MKTKDFNYNVLFFPDKEKKTEPTAENVFIETDKAGINKYYNYDAKLRVRIRWSAGVLNFNLGERVELGKWSTEAQRCNTNTTHGKKKRAAKEINAKIETVSNYIDSIFNEFEQQKIIPTIEQYRKRYNNENAEPEKAKTIFDYYDEFVNKQGTENSWKYATLQKFATVKAHLTDFSTNLSDFSFDTFTKEGLNAYVTFLRDVKDMRNSTILKQLAFVKWFLKWAKSEGIHSNDAFMTFAPKMPKAEKKVIFLDWSELMIVYNFDFSKATETLPDGTLKDLTPENKKALERVRDVFCFCCFTSLRYSDVENLKRTDIKGDEIHITTIKTDDTLTIDLNDYSKAILLKYADEVYPNNKALPVISNQRMNDHLKQLGEVCGLNTPITITYYKGAKRFDEVYPKYELIGTHCGRRTFICNALMMGIAPTTVMKWTGHSDYKSMQPYIDVADAEKKKAMSLFNR
ncbi:MAG: site-specific integrase [Bacteroidia bacterium]|nr:site-specific integrase [Bacteroidia bacterium]